MSCENNVSEEYISFDPEKTSWTIDKDEKTPIQDELYEDKRIPI